MLLGVSLDGAAIRLPRSCVMCIMRQCQQSAGISLVEPRVSRGKRPSVDHLKVIRKENGDARLSE